jgi:hypothetical protein
MQQFLDPSLRSCWQMLIALSTLRIKTMTTTKNTNGTVPLVEEIGGFVTTKKAAELMGVELPSVGAIIHSGRVKACRIAGVFLVDKSSATEFGKNREAQALAEFARKTRNERLAKLSELTDEQLEKVLAQIAADVADDVTSE